MFLCFGLIFSLAVHGRVRRLDLLHLQLFLFYFTIRLGRRPVSVCGSTALSIGILVPIDSVMWVECLLSIRFDIEEGPIVEHVTPPYALTPENQRGVVAAAFPDTNFECEYNFIYFFTMRDLISYPEKNAVCSREAREKSDHPHPTRGTEASKLYGCAYYRQKRDRSVPRGYVQQVIVLLSRLPYHVLHELILRVVVPRFSQCCAISPDLVPVPCSSTLAPMPTQFFTVDTSFNKDHYTQEVILNRAMNEIRRWPAPHPSMQYELTLLNQTLEFITPSHPVRSGIAAGATPAPSPAAPCAPLQLDRKDAMALANGVSFARTSSCSHDLSSIIPLYSLLHDHLGNLTRIWELIISHRSVFILSDTSSCAAGVANAVASLIAPLRFNGKLFPHFTTKHENLEHFRRLGKEIPLPETESLIVACTNRLLLKAFDAWHSWIVLLDGAFHTCAHHAGPPLRGLPANKAAKSSGEAEGHRGQEPLHERGLSFSMLPLFSASASASAASPTTKLPFGSQIIHDTPADDACSSHQASYTSYNAERRINELSVEEVPPLSGTPAAMDAGEGLTRQYHIRSSSDESTRGASSDRSPSQGAATLWGASPLRSPRRAARASFYADPATPATAQRFHAGFTAEELRDVLAVQVPAISSSGCEAGRSEVLKRPSNYFDANFTFILSHKDLTRSLVQQLEKISIMDAVGKEVTVSMQLDLLYGGGTAARTTTGGASGQPGGRGSPVLGGAALKDFSSTTVFSQQTVADDAVRRFFRSLTTEFLRPVDAWFTEEVDRTESFFEWCDGRLMRERLTPKAFMDFLATNHRKVIGTSIKGNLSYASYHIIYDRFCQGSLFQAFLAQRFDDRLREAVRRFKVNAWRRRYPQEERRLSLFFAFVRVVALEVLTRMASSFPKQLHDGLLEYLCAQHWGTSVALLRNRALLCPDIVSIDDPLAKSTLPCGAGNSEGGKRRLRSSCRAPAPLVMLSDEQAATIIKYLQTVELNEDQQDRLVNTYWDASDEERKEIARAYAYLFSSKAFVDRLIHQFNLRNQQQSYPVGTDERPASPALGPAGNSGARSRRVHSQMLLRTAIEDQFSKLSGPGPFPISFGLVRTEQERQEVIDLFASQFEHPDPPELQRLVSLPQTFSTRTRRRVSGSYTWFIRSLTTNEVACAVTIIAHHHPTRQFVEMPLFATGGGYKNNGFGRLLNAALMAWCTEAAFEFVMISADAQAVPFWQRLGYETMSVKERKSIEFYYQHECYQFKGATAMIGYCTAGAYNGDQAAKQAKKVLEGLIQRMTQFVIVGMLGLES
eukprot:gene5137-3688_t